MKNVMKIARTYNSFDEYVNSKEIASIYEGYENNLRDLHYRNARTEFIAAYVVETNPEENYGRSADVYVRFRLLEGIKMERLMQVNIHSCLHSNGFQIADIGHGFITLSEKRYEQTDHNRKLCVKNGYIVY